jgi:CRISPR/Cas system endoribonuclease Cas6 (RAMP superfamily)
MKKKSSSKEKSDSSVTPEERFELNMIHAMLVHKFAQFYEQNPGKKIIEFESKEVEDLFYGVKGKKQD